MTISSVSTPYLGTAMIPTVNQAQTQLTSSRPRRRLANTPISGCNWAISPATNSRCAVRTICCRRYDRQRDRHDEHFDGAHRAARFDSIHRRKRTCKISRPGPRGTRRRQSADDSATTSLQSFISQTNSTSGDQYVFGGNQFSGVAPMRRSRRPRLHTRRRRSNRPSRRSSASRLRIRRFHDLRRGRCRASSTGPFAQQFTGTNWTTNWSSASSTNTSSEIAPGRNDRNLDQRQSTRVSAISRRPTRCWRVRGNGTEHVGEQAVVTTATSLIIAGHQLDDRRTEAQSGSQAQIKQANDDMSSQMIVLQDTDRQSRQRRCQHGRDPAQHADDPDRDRIPDSPRSCRS